MTLTLSNLGEYLTNYYKENPIEESASQCRYTLQSKVVELFEDTHYCIHTDYPSYYSNNEFRIGFGNSFNPWGFACVKFTKKEASRHCGWKHDRVYYTINKVEVTVFANEQYLANVPLKQVPSMISYKNNQFKNMVATNCLEDIKKVLSGDAETLEKMLGDNEDYKKAFKLLKEEQKNENS